jgi:hypothetical protein
MKALWDITNEEVIDKWKKGESLFTVELGGLGPSYEQALQNFLFDLFAYLVDNKIPIKKLTTGKKYSKIYYDICSKVTDGRDLSGAMFDVAKGTAYQFYRYGYKEMMNKAPNDRTIQIENIKMINKGTKKELR